MSISVAALPAGKYEEVSFEIKEGHLLPGRRMTIHRHPVMAIQVCEYPEEAPVADVGSEQCEDVDITSLHVLVLRDGLIDYAEKPHAMDASLGIWPVGILDAEYIRKAEDKIKTMKETVGVAQNSSS